MDMREEKHEMIEIRIDSAMSSCFEMISKLMYMKTISPKTEEDMNRLLNELNEIIDIDKAIILDLKELNVLI